jgi:parallel beta-helix repeat protein
VIISGFTVQNAAASSAGIRLQNAKECSVNDITLESNGIGIRLDESSSGNVIYNCRIHNNVVTGIQVDGAKNEITGNDIFKNTGVTGSAIHLTAGASGNLIHFNKIVTNTNAGQGSTAVFNENSAEEVNALLNWWGNASGPSHSTNPSGTGDAVSNSVKFKPWLTVEPTAVKSGLATGDPATIDATAEASTTVVKTGTGTPTIWAASYAGNPGGTFPKSSIGKWIDVYFNDTSGVTQAEVRLYYTPDEITSLKLKEGSLRLYWWDSSNSKWVVCSDSGVNKVDHYIWARIKATGTPSLSDLTGTPFTGGTAGGGFPWWWIPIVIVILFVLIVVVRLLLRLFARRVEYE